jgi:hypothetical protein
MKIAFFLIITLISFNTFARQYIQCSALDNSTDRAVINLNSKQSTLFMTNGVHLPDELRILKNISYLKTENEMVIYQAKDHLTQELVFIPTEYINVATNYMEVELQLINLANNHSVKIPMICFSAIYQD